MCACGGGCVGGCSPARRTLSTRLQSLADTGRGIHARFGMRAYRVFLVWLWWEAGEQGVGRAQVARRVELTPIPRVADMTSITFSPVNAGVLPVGSMRIDQISGRYSAEHLAGLAIPCLPTTPASRLAAMRGGTYNDPPPKEDALATESLPPNVEFFYEIVEDGRTARKGEEPRRERYRLFSRPFRRADKNDWIVVVERQSGDMRRSDGAPPPYPVTGDD